MFRFISLGLLVGCDVLQEKIDDIEDLTNGFVAGGVYVGVEEIDSPLLVFVLSLDLFSPYCVFHSLFAPHPPPPTAD